MRKTIFFFGLIFLVLLLGSLILRMIYGPSYYFLSGEDCWMPDGNGRWVKHGVPYAMMPQERSINIPLLIMYIPEILAGLTAIYLLGPRIKNFLKNHKLSRQR